MQYAHQPMAPPLKAVGYHGVPIVATIAVLGALCIIATLASPSGRDWLGFTGCDSSIPMEEYVVLRAKKLLEERGKAMSCDIEDTIMRMSRSELWQFVQDAENAGSAPPVRSPQNVYEYVYSGLRILAILLEWTMILKGLKSPFVPLYGAGRSRGQ